MKKPKFAICITNYNSVKTARISLQSVLRQINRNDFEIIVVDNFSSDGSLEILKEMQKEGKIDKLVTRRCSRGLGRQIAFLLSEANYIVANIDTDVVYNDNLSKVLQTRENIFRNSLLAVYGMIVLPRSLAEKLGGWRDLDRHEDSDLCIRAFAAKCYMHDMTLNVVKEHINPRKGYPRRFFENYRSFRDWFRIGMKISDLPGGIFSIFKPSVLLAFVTYRFYSQYRNEAFSKWYRVWLNFESFGYYRGCKQSAVG